MLGFAPALTCSLEKASDWGRAGDGAGNALSVFNNGSEEGNGVRNENELLDGEAKTIGPGDTDVVGDGGVTGEARGDPMPLEAEDSAFSHELVLSLERFGRVSVKHGGGGRRDSGALIFPGLCEFAEKTRLWRLILGEA